MYLARQEGLNLAPWISLATKGHRGYQCSPLTCGRGSGGSCQACWEACYIKGNVGLELRELRGSTYNQTSGAQCYEGQVGGAGSRENHQALQGPQLHGEEESTIFSQKVTTGR